MGTDGLAFEQILEALQGETVFTTRKLGGVLEVKLSLLIKIGCGSSQKPDDSQHGNC